MEWGKLFANLPDDPRVQAAEADGGAGWLLVQSIAYCTRAEHAGFVPRTQVEMFGGPRLKQRVAALVREQLWLVVDGGYRLNPDIWSEERNLSDSAEKKRDADRKRIAAKRAAERAAQDGQDAPVSPDSRATCSATGSATGPATCRSDSRGLEKRREEIPVPVVSHPSVDEGRGNDDDDDIDELASAVVAAVRDRTGRVITVAEANAVAARVLARAAEKGLTVHRPPRYVAAAIAAEPDLYASLLLPEAPPLRAVLAAPDSTHEYAPDPATGLCRHCRGPWVDKTHRRRRTA